MTDEMQDKVNVEAEEVETEVVAESEEKDWAQEAQKFQDLYLRTAAEMENMRRRMQKEKEEQARYAADCIIRGLLPVLDNLGLALSYVKPDAPSEAKALAEGVSMTLKGFLDVLTDNGLCAVEACRGGCFDPNIHDAIGYAPDAELEPGLISQEVQKGYILNQRLIRPAKVLISAKNENND